MQLIFQLYSTTENCNNLHLLSLLPTPEINNDKKMKKLFILFLIIGTAGCSHTPFKSRWVKEKAPEIFNARFETSKGDFDIEVTREWSPLAADRFYQLVRHNFFTGILFYRVVPDFVAQFGPIDTSVSKRWDKYKIPDEPVIKGNLKGMLSYARAGKETRGTVLFINLKDNPRLDTIRSNGVTGFPAFGRVTRGMEVLESLYDEYGNQTMQVYDSLNGDRRRYMEMFPKLDSIKKAYLIKTKK